MKSLTNRIQLWHLLVAALLALVGTAVFVWFERGDFPQNKVVLTVEGPVQMDGGGSGEFTARLSNTTGSTLTDAHIFITLPKELRTTDGKNSISFTKDQIRGGETHEEKVVLVATSTEAHVLIDARADYSPEGVNARFIARATREVTIGSLDATVELMVPSAVYAGEEFEGTIRVNPNVSLAQTILYARLEAPVGFELTRVDPAFSNEKDATWKLGALNEGEEREVKFWGIWRGEGEVKLSARIGKYEGIRFLPLHVEEGAMNISIRPLVSFIRLAQDQTFAYYNDRVDLELVVRNDGDEEIRDVVVSVRPSQSFVSLAYSTDTPTTLLRWDGGTIAALVSVQPGDEMAIPFVALVDVPLELEISSLSFESSIRGVVRNSGEIDGSSAFDLLLRKNQNDE